MTTVTIFVDRDAQTSQRRAARHILGRWLEGPPWILGGATGRTQRGIYRLLFQMARQREIDFRGARAFFLDEYFGTYPAYHHYAMQHLRVGEHKGFRQEDVYLPRGCFFEEDDRPVTGDRLEQILQETPGQWEAKGEPGEDGVPPEIWIDPHASHPVLRAIRQSNLRYEERLQTIGKGRLQLLGIGRTGHIGFVEPGCATEESTTMLVRLSRTTYRDNAPDFNLRDGDGNKVRIQPAGFAITQGIRSIVSSAELVLSAHGASKQAAVRKMLLAPPSPQNPAGYVTTHPCTSIFLDLAAWGDLDPDELQQRGFKVVLAAHTRASSTASRASGNTFARLHSSRKRIDQRGR